LSRVGVLSGTALALAFALPAAAGAQTQSRVSADVSATAGYSNNPFTESGGNTGAAVVTVDVAPRYQLLTPRSTITVSADANIQQYLSHYGHNDSYAGAVDYQGRPSEHIAAHARIDLSSAVLGAFNSYLPLPSTAGFAPVAVAPATGTAAGVGTTGAGAGTVAGALVPITVGSPLLPYTDVGLYGSRSRRRTGRASGDLGFTLSSRDTLSVAGYAEVTRYSDFSLGNYEAFGGSLGYQRRLSDRLSAGLTGSAASYNYHGGFPDNQIYSIQATASAVLSDRWSADGALGVSFVNGGSLGRSTNSTSLSGNLDLCRRGSRSSLCVQAARQVSPTGYAGSQYVTTAGLTWNRQLDERQSVSLGGSYSKVGGDPRLVTQELPLAGYGFQSEYAQATAGYSRQLGQRLRLVASANYRELLDSDVHRPADFGGQIGLSYRFGDRS
jgi:hypothetical protein